MNNIYGDGFGGSQNSIEPFIQSIMASSQSQPNTNQSMLPQIGRSMAAPEQQQPMNTVFKDAINPYQQATLDLRKQELQQRGDIAGSRLGLDTQKVDIQKQRADAYDFKTKNPNLKIIEQRGGNTVAINPTTGEVVKDFGPSGFLSDSEKLELQQEGAMKRIGATGQQQRETALLRGDIERGNIGLRGEEDRKTKEVIPGKSTKPVDTAIELKNRVANKAQQGVIENPAWSKYITIEPDGRVSVNVPTGMFGKTAEEATKIRGDIQKYLYEETPTTETEIPQKNEITKPIPGRTDMIGVSTDGGKTWTARKK